MKSPCGKPHEKRRAKLLVDFGNAKSGAIEDADICLECGVRVASKQIGTNDEGWWLIPSALVKVIDPGSQPDK